MNTLVGFIGNVSGDALNIRTALRDRCLSTVESSAESSCMFWEFGADVALSVKATCTWKRTEGSVTVAVAGCGVSSSTVDGLLSRISNAYRTHGEEFAAFIPEAVVIVLADTEKGIACVTRDALGLNTLFYAQLSDGSLVFSLDDLHALRTLPGVSSRVDLTALSAFLSHGYVPSPYTIYHGISKLRPGHCLTMPIGRSGLPVIRTFWKPVFMPKRTARLADMTAELWGDLADAVRATLQQYSPETVGFLISGGIDSSLLCALASTAVDDPQKIHAFTVGFPDAAAYDETAQARQCAAALGVQHTIWQVVPEDWDMLPQAMQLNDEPYADSSLIPTTVAMQLAAEQGASLAVTGSGGDECYGGYRRYQAMRWRGLLHCIPCMRLFAKAFSSIAPVSTDARAKGATLRRFAAFLAKTPALAGYASFQEIFSEELKAVVLNDTRLRALPSFLQELEKEQGEISLQKEWERYNALDFQSYLQDDGGRKEFLAAQLAGISVTSPMLALPLVEKALLLPTSLRCGWFHRKIALRRIARHVLPDDYLKQPKRGFGMPVAQWFRTCHRETLLELAASHSQWDTEGWFRQEGIDQLVQEHLNGQADHAARLWTLLCLKTWLANGH